METGKETISDMANMEADSRADADSVNNETLAVLFHRACKFMMRAHHRQGYVEHAQMRLLAIVQRNAPMNQRELLEMLHVRSASLSELLEKLERRNFISRGYDQRDKRHVIITLTEQGAAAATAGAAAGKQSFDAIFAALSQSERRQLAGLLEKIIVSMERQVACHHSSHDYEGERGQGHSHQHGHGRHRPGDPGGEVPSGRHGPGRKRRGRNDA
ncbi:MAG: MarR family winged helix-turn-helix transcriptional regulator [Desulfarculales bacterium]|jgi:DNA-binding MarR family transcriptional regulator|nr:MarR family winged helix-turn-helix transcriptional regulator [Desulfarculales bacterium]